MARQQTPAPLGGPREVEPNDALIAEIHRTVGHVEALGAIVDAIPTDQLVEGVTKTVETAGEEFTTRTVTTATAPNVWLRLYREERRHLLDACRAASACGVTMAAPEQEADAVDDIEAQRAKRRSRLSGAAS